MQPIDRPRRQLLAHITVMNMTAIDLLRKPQADVEALAGACQGLTGIEIESVLTCYEHVSIAKALSHARALQDKAGKGERRSFIGVMPARNIRSDASCNVQSASVVAGEGRTV